MDVIHPRDGSLIGRIQRDDAVGAYRFLVRCYGAQIKQHVMDFANRVVDDIVAAKTDITALYHNPGDINGFVPIHRGQYVEYVPDRVFSDRDAWLNKESSPKTNGYWFDTVADQLPDVFIKMTRGRAELSKDADGYLVWDTHANMASYKGHDLYEAISAFSELSNK